MAKIDPVRDAGVLGGARVVVFGYDTAARAHALALRRAGNAVEIAVRPDGVCCARARADGFEVARALSAVERAEVIALFLYEPARVWRACAQHVDPGTLVVARSARALAAGAFDQPDLDIALVLGSEGAPCCRLAVHCDATGRALPRALAFARAAYGAETEIAMTTIAFEVKVELGSIGERAGSVLALAAFGSDDDDDDEDDDVPPRSGAW